MSAYQMLRKKTCIDNHIRSSKTLKDMGFCQSLSRSQEHLLPATNPLTLINYHMQNNKKRINRVRKNKHTFCFNETLSNDIMLVKTV